ncbi:uncharacterized protein LOC121055356 [Oryza brachyantha]|uniref:uncharacterized protein LOC121055356 n=1 Tax=Oryza brachyantha TaxID=4533 RepID=UPI001ADD033D|nr:uncharacterized protein LOC121055356 [Oryza brachyantha]
MELLDMAPADAIALRLYSLPAAAATAGSLWAWLVAALAAAVGLWRIRAAGVRSALVADDDGGKQQEKTKVTRMSALPASPVPAAVVEARPGCQEEAEAGAPVATTPTSPSEPSTPSKVRFTAYYAGSGEDDDGGVVDGVRRCAWYDNDDDADNNCSSVRFNGEGKAPLRRTSSSSGTTRPRRRTTPAAALLATPWEEREMSVRRRGDLGWYRHLDMAALDGSVVRLWRGEGEVTAAAAASPWGRRSRGAFSELHLSS